MFNSKQKNIFLVLVSVFLCAAVTISVADSKRDDASLQKINEFLARKEYLNAYQLAQKLSLHKMGESSFDLLFGKTALAVHKPDVAALAFDRVLMGDPNNAIAKFGLMQAYYNMQMYGKAKNEAQSLISGGYAMPWKNKAQTTLEEINRKILKQDRPYHFYGGILAGYDSNAALTSDGDYAGFFNVMGVTNPKSNLIDKVRRNNSKLQSFYLTPQLGIGGWYVPHRKSNYRFNWDINVAHKEYTDIGKYNTDNINATLGMNCKVGRSYWFEGKFYYEEKFKDGRRNREVPMVTLSLNKKINKHNVLKVYTTDGMNIYPRRRARSVNVYSGGLGWDYYGSVNILTTSVYYGRKQPRGGSYRYEGSDYLGIDLGFKHKITREANLVAGVAYQNSMYDAKRFTQNANDTPIRHDMLLRFSGGIHFKFHPNYTWHINNIYTKNHSNIFIYKHDRFEVLTGISFTF